jgi:CshA-type fibril repeat protein
VNDPPVANDDAASTDEDTPVVIDVLANDTDADGDTLTVDSVTQPANGTATINPDNTVTYTPDPDFNGTDSFDYTISDGNGGTDTATVTVTVGAVNDPPVANDDSASTDEDTPVTIPILDNDTDADGNLDPSSVSVTGGPFNGSAAVNPDGSVTYTPDPDFNGSDSFSYEVCDSGSPSLCDTATVLITVGAVNDPPAAADDSASTDEDTPVVIPVLANDSPGPANESSQSLTVDSVTQPANGTVVINPDGTVTYTPDPNFNGSDSFTYTACDDGSPVACDTATVTVTVGGVNDAPVANDDAASTDEDTPVVIPVLANDTDPDGDVLSTDSVTQPANGTVVINPNDTVTYTPDPGFNGADFFSYEVCDTAQACDSASVTVLVASVNDPPVANDDAATTDEDTPVTIDVLANDTDADGDALSVSSVTPPANGSAVINPDNTVTYTPDPDFNGTDSFDYTVSDGNGGTDTATVTVTVGAVNDPPVAEDDEAATLSTVPVIIDVLANDSPGPADESAQTLDVVAVTQPANGTVVLNPDDTVTYVSDPLFVGIDTFTYTVCDNGTPSLCDTATVSVTVSLLNRPPVANDDAAATNEDTPVTIDVVANDTDPDNNLDPSSVTITGGPFNGQAVSNGDGTVTYTPDPNFHGNDSFSYEVCDTLDACDSATVTITVAPVNDPPVANDDARTAMSGVPVTINVLANDSDADGDSLTVTGVTTPANGTATINPDNTITYRSNCGFQGFDSFSYTISDGNGGTDTAQVTVQVRKISRRLSIGC